MNQKIVKIIKTLEGNVLGIGLSKDMVEAIEKNDAIIECNLLNSYTEEQPGRRKRGKTIKIKKLHKYFKKKSVDTIICDYEMIQKYMNTFVKNSVYINRKQLYFFGNIDKEILTKRYHRYDTTISFPFENIAIIDNTNSKNNKFKDIGYRFIDAITAAIDFIGDVLMN